MHSFLWASRNFCSVEKKASGLLVMGEQLSRDSGGPKHRGAAGGLGHRHLPGSWLWLSPAPVVAGTCRVTQLDGEIFFKS